jgi:hypothetical protein
LEALPHTKGLLQGQCFQTTNAVVKHADVILKMSKTDFNQVFDEFQKHCGVLSSGEPILTGNACNDYE